MNSRQMTALQLVSHARRCNWSITNERHAPQQPQYLHDAAWRRTTDGNSHT